MFGSSYTGNDFRAIDVEVLACASRIQLHNGSYVGGDESCVWELKEVEAHLGAAFYLKFYKNERTFQQNVFDDQRVKNEAVKHLEYTTTKNAHWAMGKFRK